MTRLSKPASSALLTVLASAMGLCAAPAFAADMTDELDARHKECLERIAVDQELALEEAMIWRDQGGARPRGRHAPSPGPPRGGAPRARHCEAMALFALGHEGEAANRLDALADGRDGGSDKMRANFRAEAADFWLIEGEPDRAFASATAGLDHAPELPALRIARARALVMKDDAKRAEEELNEVIKATPDHAEALRYRADTRLRQGRLVAAKADAESALNADPQSVETALLRGRINEAIRLFDATAEPGVKLAE